MMHVIFFAYDEKGKIIVKYQGIIQPEQIMMTAFPDIFSLTVNKRFFYKGAFNSRLWVLTI